MKALATCIMTACFSIGLGFSIHTQAQLVELGKVEYKGMTVQWKEEGGRIQFELQAPTEGWVTIGFDDDDSIQGAYLIMGRVINGRPEVVEHFTSSPGMYRPIAELGGEILVAHVGGKESSQTTTISFSLPIGTATEYQRALLRGQSYFLIMAYSRDDDFQHHSMMRTAIQINL